jgi:hypothetical protein
VNCIQQKLFPQESYNDSSLAKKNQVPWVNDELHSDETKNIEMSEVPQSNTLSAKSKSNNAKIPRNSSSSPRPPTGRIPWNKGIPLSEETKRKTSQAHMGKPPTFKGRKHSRESRRRQSFAHRGKHPSKQTRLKISKSVKKYFAKRREEKEGT